MHAGCGQLLRATVFVDFLVYNIATCLEVYWEVQIRPEDHDARTHVASSIDVDANRDAQTARADPVENFARNSVRIRPKHRDA